MKITAKILAAFLPLAVVAAGAVGLLALRASRNFSRDIRDLSGHMAGLRDAAGKSAAGLADVLEQKLRADYEYLGHQMAGTLALSHEYLGKELASVAASTLIESYLTSPPEGRALLRNQIENRFFASVRNYRMLALCLRDAGGTPLLVMDATAPDLEQEDALDVPCPWPWTPPAVDPAGFFVETTVIPDFHVASGAPGEPLLVLVCPLRYKDNHYHPERGRTLAWLCAYVRLRDFCAPLIENLPFAPARLIVADAEDRPLIENAVAPGRATGPDDVLHIRRPALGGRLVLNLHASRGEIRRGGATESIMASLRTEAAYAEAMVERQSARAMSFSWRSALVAGGSLGLALLAGVLLARRLTEPLRRLSAVAGRLADGNLDEEPPGSGDDEIGELGRNLDRMRRTLRDHIAHLDRRVIEKTLALAASEKAYRQLFEEMTDGFALHEIVCDASGSPVDYRFLAVNPAFETLSGLPAAALTGRTAREVMPGLEQFWVDTYGVVALTGTPVRFERYSAEMKRHVSIGAYCPEKGRFAVIITDITERCRAEEERRKLEEQMQHAQKLESLGVLAGGIAHDFNNLLMAILGNADLALLELPADSPARDNLIDIEKTSRRAAELCRQMLAYSGKGRFVIERINLNELIREMGQLLEVSIAKTATMRYHFAKSPPLIEADATQIRQVVMNLLTNASEALDGKPGVMAVTTGVEECGPEGPAQTWSDEKLPGGRYAYVEISDTGCGMDAATLARIFDPFFTTKFTGRGLGLAAVIGIVRGHKGAIRVHSEPNKGSTFKVLFPAVKGAVHPARPAPVPAAKAAAAAQWKGSGTVLVVDDEESVRMVADRMLRRSGFSVLSAVDGDSALRLFETNGAGIVCVLLDLTMPRMDGEECFRRLRALRPDVRVILSSGYNEQDAVNRFAGKGLAGFLQKPYHYTKFIGVLREALES